MDDIVAREALHDFLLERAEETTEKWLLSSYENKENPYVTSPDIRRMLKSMKQSFSMEMIYMFKEDEATFQGRFRQQAEYIVEEYNEIWHLYLTVQQEFIQYRNILLEQIEEFVKQYESSIPNEHVMAWTNKALHLLDYAGNTFMQAAFRQIDLELKGKEQLITTLMAPVIKLGNKKGLLPLIGEIETRHGHTIIENTLRQCQAFELRALLIDFSGIDHIDDTVIDHIETLVKSLKLLGINITLCGIKPKIAKDTLLFEKLFNHVSITNNLQAAVQSVD